MMVVDENDGVENDDEDNDTAELDDDNNYDNKPDVDDAVSDHDADEEKDGGFNDGGSCPHADCKK